MVDSCGEVDLGWLEWVVSWEMDVQEEMQQSIQSMYIWSSIHLSSWLRLHCELLPGHVRNKFLNCTYSIILIVKYGWIEEIMDIKTVFLYGLLGKEIHLKIMLD